MLLILSKLLHMRALTSKADFFLLYGTPERTLALYMESMSGPLRNKNKNVKKRTKKEDI